MAIILNNTGFTGWSVVKFLLNMNSLASTMLNSRNVAKVVLVDLYHPVNSVCRHCVQKESLAHEPLMGGVL